LSHLVFRFYFSCCSDEVRSGGPLIFLSARERRSHNPGVLGGQGHRSNVVSPSLTDCFHPDTLGDVQPNSRHVHCPAPLHLCQWCILLTL